MRNFCPWFKLRQLNPFPHFKTHPNISSHARLGGRGVFPSKSDHWVAILGVPCLKESKGQTPRPPKHRRKSKKVVSLRPPHPFPQPNEKQAALNGVLGSRSQHASSPLRPEALPPGRILRRTAPGLRSPSSRAWLASFGEGFCG